MAAPCWSFTSATAPDAANLFECHSDLSRLLKRTGNMTFDPRAIASGILFTDEYQLTMAQVYFRHGLQQTPAQFDHYFRAIHITARTRPATASTPGWPGCWSGCRARACGRPT